MVSTGLSKHGSNRGGQSAKSRNRRRAKSTSPETEGATAAAEPASAEQTVAIEMTGFAVALGPELQSEPVELSGTSEVLHPDSPALEIVETDAPRISGDVSFAEGSDNIAELLPPALPVVADLEFVSSRIPDTLAFCGWIAHPAHQPIRWYLRDEDGLLDISDAITIYPRTDLQIADAFRGYSRIGFVAVLPRSQASGITRLEVGRTPNDAQMSLDLTAFQSAEIEFYFPRSHQLFRFAVIRRLSELTQSQALSVSDNLNQLATEWLNEIHPLEGSLHPEIAAGIDQAMFSPSGQCYVEGWVRSQRALGVEISGCVIGFTGSRSLINTAAFRRPDVQGGSGFAFVSRGEISDARDPVLLLQSRTSGSGEIAYAKLTLQRVWATDFAERFWTRVLDIHSINTDALQQISAFTRDDPAQAASAPATGQSMSMVVLAAPIGSPLRNLLVLTLELPQLRANKVKFLTSDKSAGPAEVWWPCAGKIHRIDVSRHLNDVASQIDDSYVLFVDAASFATSQFVQDVRRALDALSSNTELDCVVLASQDFVSPSEPEGWTTQVREGTAGAHYWLSLNKGQALAAFVTRTSRLKEIAAVGWPVPSNALAVRRFLNSVAANTLWMETKNNEVFFVRPSVPGFSPEQSSLLFHIDRPA
jgi:hypothetical protein